MFSLAIPDLDVGAGRIGTGTPSVYWGSCRFFLVGFGFVMFLMIFTRFPDEVQSIHLTRSHGFLLKFGGVIGKYLKVVEAVKNSWFPVTSPYLTLTRIARVIYRIAVVSNVRAQPRLDLI